MIFLFDSADLTYVLVYTVLYTNAYLDLITVNTDRPECNREVLVFPLQDIKGVKVGSHYFGYYIMFPMDIRYVLDNETIEHYKARVFSANRVLLSVPAWPYSPLYNRDEIAGKVTDVVNNAMDDARHSFEENKTSRMWKHLILEFPSEQNLAGKEIYQDAGEDEELELEFVPFVYTHTKFPSGRSNTLHYAAWKVCRTDIRPTKRGKVDQKENKSKGASLLEAMGRIS